MITKVYGTANNIDIVFKHKHKNIWEVKVPANACGEYVIEVWAENDRGGKAYLCSLLFAISGVDLKLYILPAGYKTELGKRFTDSICGCGLAKKMKFQTTLIGRG